jgi:hypothetical protein
LAKENGALTQMFPWAIAFAIAGNPCGEELDNTSSDARLDWTPPASALKYRLTV